MTQNPQGLESKIDTWLFASTIALVQIFPTPRTQATAGFGAYGSNGQGKADVFPDDLVQIDLISLQESDLQLVGRELLRIRESQMMSRDPSKIEVLFHG